MSWLEGMFGLGAFDGPTLKVGKRPGKWRAGKRSTELRRLKIKRPVKPMPGLHAGAFKPTVNAPTGLRHGAGANLPSSAMPQPQPGAVRRAPAPVAGGSMRPGGGRASMQAPVFRGMAAPAIARGATSGLSGLGQPTFSAGMFPGSGGDGSTPPPDGSTSDPNAGDTGNDSGYTPNGAIWLSLNNQQPIYWPDGSQVLYPDGTPMVGTLWLPKLDLSTIDFQIHPNLAVVFDAGLLAFDRAKTPTQPIGTVGLNTNLLQFPHGLRWLGRNVGGTSDDRLEDLIYDYIANNRGSVGALADLFERILQLVTGAAAPLSRPFDPVQPAPVDPATLNAIVTQTTSPVWSGPGPTDTLGPQVIISHSGSSTLVTFGLGGSFDWSTLDPTQQAYALLATHYGQTGFLKWASLPADLWRSDGVLISAGVPSQLPVGPFACLEFLDALVTGVHGVPIAITPDGKVSQAALIALAQAPNMAPLATAGIFDPSRPMLLCTVYDAFGQGAGAPGMHISPLPAPTPPPSDGAPPPDQGPAIDPATGLPIDPATGLPIDTSGDTGMIPQGGMLPPASDYPGGAMIDQGYAYPGGGMPVESDVGPPGGYAAQPMLPSAADVDFSDQAQPGFDAFPTPGDAQDLVTDDGATDFGPGAPDGSGDELDATDQDLSTPADEDFSIPGDF